MKKFEGIRKELQDCRHKVDGPPGGDTGTPPAGSAAPTTPPANP